MTDRELLELAAKAAGYQYAKFGGYIVVDGIPGNWNPLTDDGDALRLAVKCRIEIHHGWDDGEIVMGAWFPNTTGRRQRFEVESASDDIYGSTRRAIVRAAAAIAIYAA